MEGYKIAFEIIFSIIGTLLGPMLSLVWLAALPILVIAILGLSIRLVFEYISLSFYQKRHNPVSRYQKPSRPDNYRASENRLRCSNCDYTIRSTREELDWYCQKHQVDVSSDCVCNNYHSVILDLPNY